VPSGTGKLSDDGKWFVLPREVKGGTSAKARQHQQGLDFIGIFEAWHAEKCFGYEYFMLADDDVGPCTGSELFWRGVLKWAYAYPAGWSCIRLAGGTNGLIMKCADLPGLLAHMLAAKRSGRQLVIDWLMTNYFIKHSAHKERVFRFTLLEHRANGTSTIWTKSKVDDRDSTSQVAQCYDHIHWQAPAYTHHLNNYHKDGCEAFLFSPCEDALSGAAQRQGVTLPRVVVNTNLLECKARLNVGLPCLDTDELLLPPV
jgi:hypothetical protein